MRAIIVDDEKHCRDVLILLLKTNCPQVEVVEMCEDGRAGLAAIERLKPELVFLDIEMPGMNGFEMLEASDYSKFQVIFTTAYDEYAIKAIRHNALDYILKPVDEEELIQAVKRAGEEKQAEATEKVVELLREMGKPKKEDQRIALSSLDGFMILNTDEIFYCESDGGYTKFYLSNGKASLISKTLKEVEDVLENKGFCRVHHSFLINVKYVHRYIRGDGGEVVMANGKNIPVSRNKKQDFLSLIERI